MLNINILKGMVNELETRIEIHWDGNGMQEYRKYRSPFLMMIEMWTYGYVCVFRSVIALLWAPIKIEFIISDEYLGEM